MTQHISFKFSIGDKVEKIGGDYTFVGTVVSVFTKLSGKTRLVVEDDRGILHIFSETNLKRIPKKTMGKSSLPLTLSEDDLY